MEFNINLLKSVLSQLVHVPSGEAVCRKVSSEYHIW